MPLIEGKYIAPNWQNGGPPAIDADELNATCQRLEDTYTKEEILSEQTINMYNKDPSATPDDILYDIGPSLIGNVRSTILDSLGENWVLANGEQISILDYPELSKLLPYSFNENTKEPIMDEPFTIRDNSFDVRMKFVNNKYFLCGSMTSDGNPHSGQNQIGIVYSTDVLGEWTFSRIVPANGSQINAIAYGNGYYMVAGNDILTGSACVYYSTEPSGPWTKKIIESYQPNNGSSRAFDIVFANNKFSVLYVYFNGSRTTYKIASISSVNDVWDIYPLDYVANSLKYINNKYITSTIKNVDGNSLPTIYYSDSINSGWVQSSISDSRIYNRPASTIVYTDNKYIVFIKMSDGNKIYYAYSESLDGPWNVVEIRLTTTSGARIGFNNIIYENGIYFSACSVWSSNKSIVFPLSSTNIDGPWEVGNNVASYSLQGNCENVLYENNKFIIISNDDQTQYGVAAIYSDTQTRKLPIISLNNANVFIKAK